MIFAVIDQSIAPELTAMGLVGTGFVLLLKWVLNTTSVKFDEARKTDKGMALAIHTNNLLLLGVQDLMLRHDITIRGINPSAGDDAEGRAKEAIKIYTDIKAEMERTRSAIERAMENLKDE